jgi:deoxyribonuclease IV
MDAMKKHRIGLKLWSTDSRLLPEVKKLYEEGYFDYVELYAVPGTYNSSIEEWGSFEGKYIIHCSHSGHGFNLGDPGLKRENRIKFQESQAFADALKADSIIVHLGHSGSLNEAILQLNGFPDDRICVENKPVEGLNGEVCLGNAPQEISRVLDEANVPGFVLDFGHAIYSANSLNEEKYGFVERFMSLGPKMFHLSDGLSSSTKDCHLKLGQGELDLRRILSFIPSEARVTLETPRKKDSGLEDFAGDVDFLSDLLKE